MTKREKSISFEATFGTYVVDELLGEGGAGQVYGELGIDQTAVALKILDGERATADKRRRFKNEIALLVLNKHRNVVTVTDHGIARSGETVAPFYVRRRYYSRGSPVCSNTHIKCVPFRTDAQLSAR
jgi:serine/threonine protein kinase